MNISLQLCGLVIAVLLFILFKSHITLGLRGEKIFLIIIIATGLCLSLDALSVVAIHFRNLMPLFLVKLICKAYLISMVWVGWGNFCYVSLDLKGRKVPYLRLKRLSEIYVIIASIVIAVLPIGIHEGSDGIYSFGPAVISTYAFVLYSIISILVVAIMVKRRKNSRRGSVVIMTTSLWIFAAILQMYNNSWLLVGFSMAVGVMVLYVVLENPDSNLDRQYGCFNSHAMQRYLAMCLESGKSFHVLDLSLSDLKSLETGGVDVAKATRTVIERLEAENDIKVFKNQNTGLVIVSPDAEKLDEVSRKAMKLISKYPGAGSVVTIFVVRNAEQFPAVDTILRFLTYVRGQNDSHDRLSAVVNVSEDMVRSFNQTQEIRREIDLALAEDRVEAFLQPICSIDGVPSFAEALVRIRQKDGSLLSPGLFIPVAESTGQVKELGERVLEKVCKFLRDSGVLSMGLSMVDVNLSAVQCDDSAMAGRLCLITDRYDIAPRYISFEITETAVSEVKDALIENMNALVSKGFCFALDDFGKGESNLMYIVEMPGQIIKLDMDMTKAYFSNPKARPVVEAIVAMAKQLNLTTIAEGVETEEELKGIAELGIDYIQGYYFSRPLPMDEFVEYMRENTRFVKELPLADQQESDIPETAAAGMDVVLTKQWLDDHRVLLVEDNEINSEIAQDILEDLGFTVDSVEDGTIAVDKIKNSQPGQYGLVLMDIRMPIMDGYEATRRIRNLDNEALASVPIVALTSQNTEEDRRASYDAGMNDHMCKPLDGTNLTAVISRLFFN